MGTTFKLFFPRVAEMAENLVRPVEESGSWAGSGTILQRNGTTITTETRKCRVVVIPIEENSKIAWHCSSLMHF
jgi:hypothetical protein